jgi:hypothetical protein
MQQPERSIGLIGDFRDSALIDYLGAGKAVRTSDDFPPGGGVKHVLERDENSARQRTDCEHQQADRHGVNRWAPQRYVHKDQPSKIDIIKFALDAAVTETSRCGLAHCNSVCLHPIERPHTLAVSNNDVFWGRCHHETPGNACVRSYAFGLHCGNAINRFPV